MSKSSLKSSTHSKIFLKFVAKTLQKKSLMPRLFFFLTMVSKVKYATLHFYSRNEIIFDKTGFCEKIVLLIVDKQNQHPDPMRLMLWGYNTDGKNVKGDFARNYERVRVNTLSKEQIREASKIPYIVPPLTSYSQEVTLRIKAILFWIESNKSSLKRFERVSYKKVNRSELI